MCLKILIISYNLQLAERWKYWPYRLAFLFSSPEKSIDNQSILFSGEFIQLISDLLNEAIGSKKINDNAKQKVRGVLSRMDQLIGLIEKKKVKEHSISGYLSVELHEKRSDTIKETNEGIVVIKLWSED